MIVYVLIYEDVDNRFGSNILGVYASKTGAQLAARCWMEEGEKILSEEEGNFYSCIQTTDGTYTITQKRVES